MAFVLQHTMASRAPVPCYAETMVIGIEHTAIASADHPALGRWYVETLGFVINYQSAGATFVKAPNGTMIEIISAEGERSAATLKTPGLRHLALAVDNFDEVYASIKAKGVNFLTEPTSSKGNKLVFFTDPEGNILHLIEREKPLP
ncbi:MAG: VOC family protein [Bryobacteraceae bacterium]